MCEKDREKEREVDPFPTVFVEACISLFPDREYRYRGADFVLRAVFDYYVYVEGKVRGKGGRKGKLLFPNRASAARNDASNARAYEGICARRQFHYVENPQANRKQIIDYAKYRYWQISMKISDDPYLFSTNYKYIFGLPFFVLMWKTRKSL